MGEEGAPSRATVGNVAMAARSGTCSPMPWPMPPQPQAREEGTTTPLARSCTGEQAEALACNCSLNGESRTPIAFAHPPQASAAASDAEPLVRPRAEESRPPQLQAREEETPAPLAPSSAGEHSEARARSLGEERLVHILFSTAQASASASAAAPLARPWHEEARACKKVQYVIAACTV